MASPADPAKWDDDDAHALQALARDVTHKRAFTWIIEKACGTYAETHVPGDGNTSAYLAGRRSAGRQIVNLINLDMGRVKEAREKMAKAKPRRAVKVNK